MTPNTPRTSVFDSGDFNFFMSSIREAIGERPSLETTWPRNLTFLRKKKVLSGAAFKLAFRKRE